MKKGLRIPAAVILLLLGGITVFMASSILFDWFELRQKQGNYVPFVVYTNLVCGLVYLYAAYGLIKMQKKAAWLLIFATGLLVVVSVVFALYVYFGGMHEERTVFALMFRTIVTGFLAWLSFYVLKNKTRTVIKD